MRDFVVARGARGGGRQRWPGKHGKREGLTLVTVIMPKKPNFTLYFNPDEIATAIAEVRGSVLVETVTKKGTDKSRKGSIDLGLGSGILSLLRIGKASLKAEKGSRDRQELTERSEFPIEAQLESLLSDLQSYLGTGFFTRLDD